MVYGVKGKKESKMKKLILAAAIVCAAAMSQAASVGWSLAGLSNYAGDAYSLFIIGQNEVTSVAQITALLDAGKSVSSYAFYEGNVANNGAANVLATASGLTVPNSATYTSFFVVFDDADASSAANYLAITADQSANLTKSVNATAASVTFAGGNQSTYANNPANWSAVPEPTSGLLMLLGVAGLALRRRRA